MTTRSKKKPEELVPGRILARCSALAEASEARDEMTFREFKRAETQARIDEAARQAAITVEHAELLDKCHEHLSDTGVILWGRFYDLNSTDGRTEAATWLAGQIEAVLAL